ncbi:MAG TPA: cupin domain-containing protein [Geomonas sp.]|nr:cupin domain-containing protein [Geomonas sp.]
MSNAIKLDDLPWTPVRPEIATGISGKTMLDTATKMVYTRVEAGGGFAPHVDGYDHLMYILNGRGVAVAGGIEYRLEPGLMLEIEAGEEHCYRNTGSDLLELLSLNVPAR